MVAGRFSTLLYTDVVYPFAWLNNRWQSVDFWLRLVGGRTPMFSRDGGTLCYRVERTWPVSTAWNVQNRVGERTFSEIVAGIDYPADRPCR